MTLFRKLFPLRCPFCLRRTVRYVPGKIPLQDCKNRACNKIWIKEEYHIYMEVNMAKKKEKSRKPKKDMNPVVSGKKGKKKK